MYVTRTGAFPGTVSVINCSSNTVAATVNVQNTPRGCVYHTAYGGRVYIVNETSSSVSVLATSSNSIVNTIAVGSNPWRIAANLSGERIYVANVSGQSVSVINTVTETVVATLSGLGLSVGGVAYSPAVNRFYVTFSGGGQMNVYNASTNTSIATLTMPGPTTHTFYAEGPNRLYSGSNGGTSIYVNEAFKEVRYVF
jgi:YVTN family beta-propeller protein